ncbi:MAG: MBL fold metallo-hydrolase [Candidatus Riflebacteria bacterium HGW-Riflebacteria-1]|nr:MAG: MBL fold metallo-hydrolase [Candidatus Riflebacteria bacterium HGW-Riflebacteria-1]
MLHLVTFKSKNLTCERFILGSLQVNTYLVYETGSDKALIIDPAEESPTLLNRVIELGFNETTIFLTHGHADHLAGVEYFRTRLSGCRVAISQEDAPMLGDPDLNLSSYIGDSIALKDAEIILKDKDVFGPGGEIVSVPGHTPGGLILVFPGMVFSGDTLFAGSIGRSDFPGGDGRQLIKAIKDKIFTLSDRYVFPGHGPETRIAEEQAENPFFSDSFTV